MRARLLVTLSCLVAVAGFRCPGGAPTPAVELGTGGTAGASSSSSKGGASTTGEGGASTTSGGGTIMAGPEPPPPDDCELACAGCERPVICQNLCETQEIDCGPEPTRECYDFHGCELLDVGVCLASDFQCPPTLDGACEALCAGMLNRCSEPDGGYATVAVCAQRCEDELIQKCSNANGEDVLGCGASHLASQCDQVGLDGCFQGACQTLEICPSNWIYAGEPPVCAVAQ